jgi:hypothetical protein
MPSSVWGQTLIYTRFTNNSVIPPQPVIDKPNQRQNNRHASANDWTFHAVTDT